MRGKLEDLVEIINAFQEGDHLFAVVGITRNGETQKFRFGITEQSYAALRKVLQNRPFDNMPGTQYRHYYSGGHSAPDAQEMRIIGIHVESGNQDKVFNFAVPTELLANLIWWAKLEDFASAQHLRYQPEK